MIQLIGPLLRRTKDKLRDLAQIDDDSLIVGDNGGITSFVH